MFTNNLTINLSIDDFPFSPSFGSYIDVLGTDLFENWKEKVDVEFHSPSVSIETITNNWKKIFSVCDEKKLSNFLRKHNEDLVKISGCELELLENNNRKSKYKLSPSFIYDYIDPIIEKLSDDFMSCIDRSKFTPIEI